MSEEKNEKLEPNPEHLAKLKEGVEVWNKWCQEQGKIDTLFRIQLKGANFRGAHLKGAYLSDANLEGADFSYAKLEGTYLIDAQLEDANFGGANLEGADFGGAKLKGANFRGAYLKGANFRSSQFKGADFSDAQFKGANFSDANLEGANFRSSQLEGANFRRAQLENANFDIAHTRGIQLEDARPGIQLEVQFEGADFSYARLKGANFNYARLKGADFSYADLTSANLVSAKNINFSDNKIAGATMTSTTTAPWLTLKKSYTNTMMIYTLAAVFAFFLPYVVNVATWRSVNLAQQLNSELEASLAIVATELETEGHPQAFLIRKLSDGAENTTPCFAEDCKPWRIWELLLGARRHWGFALLSIPIILYNFARVYLTREVNILKDSEQATGLTPRWTTSWPKFLKLIPYPSGGYEHLYWIHQVVEKLLWVAIVSFVYHSVFWLGDIVQLPIKP